MTDCFDSVVTLREYCTPETPFSGIYLNDIGLSKRQIEDIITGDFDTVRSLVEATIRIAAREVAQDVYGRFSNTVTAKSLIETGTTGFNASTPTIVTTTGDVVGIKIDLDNTANFMNVEVKSVSLYLNHSGAVPVLIRDLDTGTLLDTISITAVAGQVVTVNVNKLYRSGKKPLRLFIGYNAAGINSYKTTTRTSNCCGNYGRNTDYTHIHGWNYTDSANLQTTSGVGLTYSLSCDQFAWMCTFSQLLALPIAHKVAAEIYRRGLMVSPATRSNNTTNTNADLMTSNLEWHLGKYSQQMDSIIKTIHVPTNTVCYSCKPVVQHRISLP
jgi:hypothetical protein